MNAVNVADRILEGVSNYRKAAPSHAKSIPLDSVLNSAPLMTIPEWDNHPSGKFQGIVGGDDWLWNSDGTPRLPFSVLRAHWPSVSSLGTSQGIIWAGQDDIRLIVCFSRDSVVLAGALGRFNSITKQAHGVSYKLDKNGVITRDDDATRVLYPMMVEHLWHYAYPQFQPVSVSPDDSISKGRSAEWKQARSFYSVVHRRSGTGTGLPHAGKRSDTLTAHARRAHLRVLRSPLWGKNQGKTVWVRSAWVGPKEWHDASAKQVYRVAKI